ncbi:hypothetical protein [Pseudoalteromonas sp. Of7M-16]|uniref:DUF7661 family protein n=1 Tax=Pseudoalteromonas sp. Of7M-16 TaxID=2917756 RepID=UPI001EF6415A|nr:hypothetical protein [Pseudoalteromonas sp. Of7M-16]MCG7551189.1 hypothetical protein [Pseudoalteromonas sp. Of7M-16]
MKRKFNVFGKVMSVYREADEWVLYTESDTGMRARVYDVVIPSELAEDKLAQFLDDIFHEFANQRYQSVFQVD